MTLSLDFGPLKMASGEAFDKGANPNSVAALKVAAPAFKNVSDQIVEMLQRYGAMTCEQVAQKMGKYPNQISGRFAPLEAKGRIEKVGTDKTHTKCQADLWRAK